MKITTISLLLAVLIASNLFGEDNRAKNNEKSILGGVLLGSIGLFLGPIPGSYGWGNFYAKDYTGFAILNIGGSICAVSLWVEVALC